MITTVIAEPQRPLHREAAGDLLMVDQKVRAALRNLLNACLAADANEELSEFIDGSLLDAARAALASGAEGKK